MNIPVPTLPNFQTTTASSKISLNCTTPEPQSVTIGGYYISDNPSVPTKWIIPDGIAIAPNGFKKIWCSGRNEYSDGNLHTNFHLTQTKNPAESITLADASGTIIDQQILEITQLGHSRGRATGRQQHLGRVHNSYSRQLQ